jgi:hypothetical protein
MRRTWNKARSIFPRARHRKRHSTQHIAESGAIGATSKTDVEGCHCAPCSVKHLRSFDMADPKDLKDAADAIQRVREMPAVQRHKELENPLRQAEEWARKEHRMVRERNGSWQPDDVSVKKSAD